VLVIVATTLRAGLRLTAAAAFLVFGAPVHAQSTCHSNSSSECRYLAFCTESPPRKTPSFCACEWQTIKDTFPETQMTLVADVLEALAANDKQRAESHLTKLGPMGAIEFWTRVQAAANASAAKCK
jgi:hypothetical protein